jgi:hypothetical protein
VNIMVVFLIGLMAIVSAFAAVGKPVNLPPSTNDDVKVRGSVVSETAKNLVDGSDVESDTDTNVNVQSATKVSAYNTKSGKAMPALIPQVAVDNSVALSTEANAEVDSSEAQVSGDTSLNAEFGQSVATSQPESAKTDGKAFGTATQQAAVGNRNR